MCEDCNNKLISVAELMEYLGVSRKTAYSLVQSGAIPSHRITERTIRIRMSDVNAYIEKH